MRSWLILLILLLAGCSRGGREAKSARTEPFLTPAERARLPVEERNDPYVIMHTLPAGAVGVGAAR